MVGDECGVRIVPPELVFDNTSPGSVYTLNVAVKNVSTANRNIRYYAPKDKHFKLKVKNPESALAPGLSVAAVVQYKPTNEEVLTDRLIVTVDCEVMEVPISGLPVHPVLDMPALADLGSRLANSKVVSKSLSLVNSGSKAGKFNIQYIGEQPISINPNQGSVPRHSTKTIKVEFVARTAGEVDEEARVELEGRDPFDLRIRCMVTKPALEILSCKDDAPMRCMPFGNTYYGTDRTEMAILYNSGPEVVNYVAIVDENAVAQELGVDLTLTTLAALVSESDSRGKGGYTNDITSIVAAIPNQGVLQPFQKVPIFFRFSPRWNLSKWGWKSKIVPPPRKDFALFIRLEIVGSNEGYVDHLDDLGHGTFVEIALTGTALPVLLDIRPTHKFDFGECPVGEHADVLCTVRNESAILPAIFQFRRIAHFSACPINGKILPNQAQDVIFSFAPKQVGTFTPQMQVDVLGQMTSATDPNPLAVELKVIYTLVVYMSGHSNTTTRYRKPIFNPGLTPLITNEVGLFVNTTFADLDEKPRNAVCGAYKTMLHRLRPRSMDLDRKKVKVAFPNDLAKSVRPAERDQPYKTLFLGQDRHWYIDPDYAFDDNELSERAKHRDKYVEHLHYLRSIRDSQRMKKEYKLTNNPTDIGIKTAAGLKPRKLTVDDIQPDPPLPTPPNLEWRPLSTKELAEAQREAMSKPVQEGLKAVPTTMLERCDCARKLSPQELHQVIIGPPTIDFGKVCLRSVSHKEMMIINNLTHFIHVEASIDCKELRQSSPLSQVVPPRSRAVIPIIFESGSKGQFQRSVTYTINKFYTNHVTVTANVVPVALELSATNLILRPSPGLPIEAGFRGIVTLMNKLNYQADFTWSPQVTDKGTAFSIRPAQGTVNAFCNMDCEVVWHPAFTAPERGSFNLYVHGGSPLKLECQAILGPTTVVFVYARVAFNSVPVNLTTTKMAVLQNTGANHAFFQVLDPNPFPGLTVTPVQGVVPVGGTAEVAVSLTPDSILKFDTRVQLAVKGSKALELRMGGCVEPPDVDVDVPSFNFGGVYCGSTGSVTFNVINRAQTRCKVEFDLSHYTDFCLHFHQLLTPEDYAYQLMNPGMTSVSLKPKEKVSGELVFTPSEVAAYDFIMPVTVNHIATSISPSAAPSPSPRSKVNAAGYQPRSTPIAISLPRKHVIATAMRQPLLMSTNRIEFNLPGNFYQVTNNTGLGSAQLFMSEQTTVMKNTTDEKLNFGLDLRKVSQAMEEGVLKFMHPSGVPFITFGSSNGIEKELEPGEQMGINVVFCPKLPGVYEAVVPVVINENWGKPYQMLYISGQLLEPRLWFEPPGVCLMPVPLLTPIQCHFTVMAMQYPVINELTVEAPEVVCEDGETISPITVTFPEGNQIKACGDEGQTEPQKIPCTILFSSPKPTSFCKAIVFKDSLGHSFQFYLTATADNCILTCYPYLAMNRMTHNIVREGSNEEDVEGVPQAMMITRKSNNSRRSTSATSSAFQQMSTSYEPSPVRSNSTMHSSPAPREGAMNRAPLMLSEADREHSRLQSRLADVASRLGSAVFPDENSEEGMFHLEVLAAVQRWFSANGWPGGPFPISIPHTLRTSGDLDQPRHTDKKNVKTVFTMVAHLSGRPVPGVPINPPHATETLERIKLLYWEHSTFLTFLRCQGALLASVQPEYLFAPEDFETWQRLQAEVKHELILQDKLEEAEQIQMHPAMNPEVFDAISKRAWTDVLLQILKVLVLSKVTPRLYKSLTPPDKAGELPPVNPDPLLSNIYGLPERILLAWLNHLYNSQRTTVWPANKSGGPPSRRWVVNFDLDLMDGLVLGAVMGAYMPFIVTTHLAEMYTQPANAEQCLHNALKLVSAMHYAGMDYDIQAVDLTDPNPILMLMLVVYLFNTLPQYLPRATIYFSCAMHDTVGRQVKVSNPSSKPLTYQVLLAGRDARDFHVPRGSHITIGSRSSLSLTVEFTSRYLRPSEATLVLMGTLHSGFSGSALAFNLRTQIDNIVPTTLVQVESPCFELKRIALNVVNPFPEAGRFSIVLVESSSELMDSGKPTSGKGGAKKSRSRKLKQKQSKSRDDDKRTQSPPPAQASQAIKITGMNDLVKLTKEGHQPKLTAFFCPTKSVYLQAKSSAEVEVKFLPFSVGDSQCSVIFLNEGIGEFLYSIEARALMPLPSPLPYVPSIHHGITVATPGEDTENVLSFRAEANTILEDKLYIPIMNMAKERALVLAAHQHMSDEELARRAMTGTLLGCSVTTKAIKMLATDPEAIIQGAIEDKGHGGTVYSVDFDSDYFRMSHSLKMPLPSEARQTRPPPKLKTPKGVNMESGFVELPFEFMAKSPGTYPCQVVLRAPDDIRILRLQCTVKPEGSTAEIMFNVPVHMSTTQDIPILNVTNQDWRLNAEIKGEGFSGPRFLHAKPCFKSIYPLTFKPTLEKPVTGTLTLTNEEDGQVHQFFLTGVGEKPMAQDIIKLSMDAKQKLTHTIKVPNNTKKKLLFQIESDIPFLTGKQMIYVLPRQQVDYSFTLAPRNRGNVTGSLAFIACKHPDKDRDSDGDEVVQDVDVREFDGYRIWYSLEVEINPPPPERVIPVVCACQKRVVIDIIVRNPTPELITLNAEITGRDLTGPESITLDAGERDSFVVTFAPSVVGKTKGSIVFTNELVGEFWYDLELDGRPPPAFVLPHMECELGKWCEQTVHLTNPTDEMVELIPHVTNSNNFFLVCPNTPVHLQPRSAWDVPLHFMPSALGPAEHTTHIIFSSPQQGDWVYSATGSGLLPQPQETLTVYSTTGQTTTLIVPFRNPMDVPVLAHILLTDTTTTPPASPSMRSIKFRDATFKLLLKNARHAIRVEPKATVDIPVTFSPIDMRTYTGQITVVINKEDGSAWDYPSPEAPSPEAAEEEPGSRTSLEGIKEIRWVFPVKGIPELQPVKESHCWTVECQARDSLHKSITVDLMGVVPAMASRQSRSSSVGSGTLAARQSSSQKKPLGEVNSIMCSESLLTTDEFEFSLICQNEDMVEVLPNCVEVTLAETATVNGVVKLTFDIHFSPFRTMNSLAYLNVVGALGGLWKFPLRFVATDPPVDDIICVEASAGLKRVSSLTFQLTSSGSSATPFTAYFDETSDPELTVFPPHGELLPESQGGTEFLIHFMPTTYGKVCKGKLIIQCPDMQWSYEVRGVLPEYKPPTGQTSIPPKEMMIRRPRQPRHLQHNFVLENLLLHSTAASSPIKGAPLVPAS